MGRSDDIAELRAAASRLLQGIDALAGEPGPSVVSSEARVFDDLYRIRRVRDEVFGMPELFGEPAWDMLLGLARAEHEGKQTSVTALCGDSQVATTTALRWITHLEEMGLIGRRGDDRDRRRSFLFLTAEGRAKLRAFAERVALPRERS